MLRAPGARKLWTKHFPPVLHERVARHQKPNPEGAGNAPGPPQENWVCASGKPGNSQS